jgi:hypothetical protein
MNKHESLEEELKALSPLLREQKRRPTDMQVPPGYFDHFEDALFSRIESEGAARPTLTARPGGLLRNILKPRMWAAAAAVVAIAATSWWMLRPETSAPIPNQAYAETLTEEEIESYVLDNITEFDSEQLAAVEPMPTQELPEAATPATRSEENAAKALDDISPEEMENLIQHMSEEELESLL